LWPKRSPIEKRLLRALTDYSATHRHLPGVHDELARRTLAAQMVASLRRLDFTQIVRNRPISPARANPSNPMFDPERAAMLHARDGNLDEAFWLVFLATHFGKHGRYGWKRLKDVYSGLGGITWTWARVAGDPTAFRDWLRLNASRIGGAFSNHRKYETLRTDSDKGTASVVESYLNWVGPTLSHSQRVRDLVREAGNDPNVIFDHFYRSMNVRRFGRLAKFEFLALVGRLDLAPIEPGSTYLKGATGPLRGARLLFGGDVQANLAEILLENWLRDLDHVLNVGMQAMEDSLCNWQKSPRQFKHFLG
jgi:hypothetical protein